MKADVTPQGQTAIGAASTRRTKAPTRRPAGQQDRRRLPGQHPVTVLIVGDGSGRQPERLVTVRSTHRVSQFATGRGTMSVPMTLTTAVSTSTAPTTAANERPIAVPPWLLRVNSYPEPIRARLARRGTATSGAAALAGQPVPGQLYAAGATMPGGPRRSLSGSPLEGEPRFGSRSGSCPSGVDPGSPSARCRASRPRHRTRSAGAVRHRGVVVAEGSGQPGHVYPAPAGLTATAANSMSLWRASHNCAPVAALYASVALPGLFPP